MSINENGFLSREMCALLPELNTKFGKYIEFAYKLNRIAQEQKNKYSCNSFDRLKTIANCLFIKILNGFQACIILIEKMMPYEASALSRTLCDPLYLLRILGNEEEAEFWKDFVRYGSVLLRKKINVAEQNPELDTDFIKKFIPKEYIDSIELNASAVDKNQFRVERLAIKAGMKTHYDVVFRHASDDIHTPPNVVNRYVEFDDNYEAKGFDWGAKDDNVDWLLLIISSILIDAISLMDKLHGIDHHHEHENIINEWKRESKAILTNRIGVSF